MDYRLNLLEVADGDTTTIKGYVFTFRLKPECIGDVQICNNIYDTAKNFVDTIGSIGIKGRCRRATKGFNRHNADGVYCKTKLKYAIVYVII